MIKEKCNHISKKMKVENFIKKWIGIKIFDFVSFADNDREYNRVWLKRLILLRNLTILISSII